MKAKALILIGALSASMVAAAPAQAHQYHDGFPYGVVGGLLLGLTWSDYYDRHYDYYGDRHYRHREYRRSDSYGRHRNDRHRHHRDHGRDRHHHRRDR